MASVAYRTQHDMPIEDLCINTIRTLAMDAVQKANSGHPGTPMALAPAAYVLWNKFLCFNPQHPQWSNRDRFILSNGHASMLLYALLHLSGYKVSLDDIKRFRQWGSNTPGHPEHELTEGVEVTTGPLGQGLMNSVGMAIAEAHLSSVFNRDNFPIVDHYTYVFCSDGDLMEGASHESASLAGHLKLHKLIWLYDDNHITIDGDTAITYSDDVVKRFEAYHWHVQNLGDNANNLSALESAYANARAETNKPSLIIVRSHIAYGAPHAQDTPQAHGAPLGNKEIEETKRAYGWPHDASFMVPDVVLSHMQQAKSKGNDAEQAWQQMYSSYRGAHPDLARQFEAALAGQLPEGWDKDLPYFKAEDAHIATREASGKALNHLAEKIPWLIGGAGDLASSTKAAVKSSGTISANQFAQRNIAFGVREHVMCGACSGMAWHGGMRPFASTFFIFTDYARPAIRLAAIAKLPIIYVLSHDSIGLGEDGPTHQPIEHLASFRAMPNMCVIRPCDANETVDAWCVALGRNQGPTMLILSRQGLPVFDRDKLQSRGRVAHGAYVFSAERGAPGDIDLILIATGSEMHLAVAAQGHFITQGNPRVRVVSMPSWEIFRAQPKDYRDSVLPPHVKTRLAVEAGATQGWQEWVGDTGVVIGINSFGASAKPEDNFLHYGFSVENIVEKAEELLYRKELE